MLEGRALQEQMIRERLIKEVLPHQPEYLTVFFNRMKGRVSAHTLNVYINNIIRFLNYVNSQGYLTGKEELQKIDFDVLNNYMNTMTTRTVNKTLKSYSLTYKKEVKSSLSTFFDVLVDLDILKTNLWRKVEIERGKDAPQRVYLKPEELKNFIGTVREGIGSERAVKAQLEWRERDEALISLMIETGMRVGTAILINIDDVNFVNNKIVVRGKGNKVDEYIITPHLAALLQLWIDKRKTLVSRSERALFLSNQKQRISYSAIRNLVDKYTGKIDKHITPHKIRASFATNYYNFTKDLIKTQQAMKHSDASITQIYIVTDENETTKASSYMSSLIND